LKGVQWAVGTLPIRSRVIAREPHAIGQKKYYLLTGFFFRGAGASLENENIQKTYLRIVTRKFDGESVVGCTSLLV
jgi:hypothetical protein